MKICQQKLLKLPCTERKSDPDGAERPRGAGRAVRGGHTCSEPATRRTTKGTEETFQVVTVTAETDTKPQIQEAQRAPISINAPQRLHYGISYSNCRKSKTKRMS